MSGKKLKVLIVGAGYMGDVHACAYKKIDDVEIFGVMDKNNARASDFSIKHCCRPFTELKDALVPEVDFVDICLPTPCHMEAAKESFKADKDVICEKPISLSEEEAGQIVQASEEYGKKLMVAHVVRFWSEYAMISGMIKRKEIKDIKYLTLSRYGSLPMWSEGGWLLSDKKSGGIIYDLTIHDIDFAVSLFGMPEWVFAKKSMSSDDYTIYVNEILGYDNMNVMIEAGFVMPRTYPFKAGFRLSTGKVSYEYDCRDGKGLVMYSDSIAGEKLEYEDCDPYKKELQYFIECIQENRQPQTGTGYDAVRALKVAKCIDLSARSNEKIWVT